LLALGEHSLSDIYFKGLLVARAHRDIANLLIGPESPAPLRFEPYWLHDLALEEREEIVLWAFEEATNVTVAFGSKNRRLYVASLTILRGDVLIKLVFAPSCPDLTVSSLARDNKGFGMISLVRFIT
jgi:hypothetical protein